MDSIKIRFDFENELVYYERWRAEAFLGIIKIEKLEDYLIKNFKEKFKTDFFKQLATEKRKRVTAGGLIPTLEIPRLPFLGETHIKISGEDRISFGGRQTVYSSRGQRERPRMLPELKMSQDLKLRVTGEIAGKTKINIDHDSRRQQAENKISIVYTGTEDEVIRKIEGGDIHFGFPHTRYTGDIPHHKGLFGIRTEGALGPINLFACASREATEPKESEFIGRARVKHDTFYDYEYAKYKFFILDTNPQLLLRIRDFKLFYDDGNPYNDIPQNAIRCLATIYPDAPDSLPPAPDERLKAGFVPLQINKDYFLRVLPIFDTIIPVIELNIPIEAGNLGCFFITDVETIGGKKYQDSLLVLKLLKKRRFERTSPTFRYALRNIYQIPEKHVKIKKAKIYRTTAGLITEYEDTRESFLTLLGLDPDFDGEINYPYFQPAYGLIIFPELYPFLSRRLTQPCSIIYFKEPLAPGEGGKYFILLEYSSAITEFYLGATDIIENSEKVYINRVIAEKGKDYTIDYKKGIITFLRLSPDAEIKVTFEQLPFFAPKAKTFGGFRAQTKLVENLLVGTSLLLRSEGTYSDKPEIGYEPFNKGILAFNLDYSKDFSLFNQKPRASISAEIASSFKNSNTLNNAYIDDFEGAKLEFNLDIRGSYFFFAPIPYFGDTNNLTMAQIKNPREKYYIRKDSIFGEQIGREGEERSSYLMLQFDNLERDNWFGICQAVTRGRGIQLENYELLEMIFRVDSGLADGIISFHLASYLEEDVPRRTKDGKVVGYNNIFDTEDKNGNNEIEIHEDYGLDGVFGDDKVGVFGDDQNDDYLIYDNPLGTEGNNILNSEDIDFNGFDSRGNNQYFVYSVRLGETRYIKDLKNNWKVITIPLKRPDTIFGRPHLNDIRKLAIYFHNFTNGFKMRIYSIKFTGVRWKRPRFLARTTDTTITRASIYSVSNKNRPDYISPFKVKKDIRGIYYEASLGLEIDSFFPYDTVITEMFLATATDLRKYSQLAFYVHKPKDFSDIMIYFRLGSDSSNFYGIPFLLKERDGWKRIRKVPYGDWYEVLINLDTLPIFKLIRKEVIIRGAPSLNNIRYYALGCINIFPSKVSYTILFNDLRVNKPKNEMGLIYGVNSSFLIPDIGFNIGFNLERQDPHFSRLTHAPAPARNSALNYSFNSSIDLSKILPSFLNISLPLNYNRISSFSLPYYLPSAPDLILKDKTYEERSGREQYGFSFKRTKSFRNPFLKYTIDAFSYSFSKTLGFNNQTLSIDTSNTINHGFSYNISPDLGIRIKEKKIGLFPKNISISLSLSDNESKRKTRAKEIDTFNLPTRLKTKNASLTYNFSYSPLERLDINYSCGSFFNRLGYLKERRGFLGVEEGLNREASISYNFSLFELIEPNFSIDAAYDEARAKARGDTYTDIRRISNNFSFSSGLEFDLPEFFQRIRLEKIGDIVDVINFDYNFSKGSEYPRINFRPELLYQLGLKERLAYDSSQRKKDYEYRIDIGSSFKISFISLRWGYEKNWEKSFYGLASRQGSFEVKFPSFDITIGNIERIFPKLFASSQINMRLDLTKRLSSRLGPDGRFIFKERSEEHNLALSPLFGWQINFKNRMNSSINLNYSKGSNYNALSNIYNYNRNKGFSLSYSYTFSLKEGIRLPILKRIRLTQDISLTSNFAYNLSERYYIKELKKTFLSRSSNYNLSFAFSYNLSHYTQMGLNTSYSNSLNLLRGDNIQSVDINLWVLFRF